MSRRNQCLHKEPDGTRCPNDARPGGKAYCELHAFKGTPNTYYTRGGPQDPPIVISGGSVLIEFDDNVFPPVGRGRHANADKKIRRVEIEVDGSQQTIDVPDGKVVVRIYYDNP
ncbi:MAG: hypothetical protein ABW208_00440 [Pyrinomonadaceae bacterium]